MGACREAVVPVKVLNAQGYTYVQGPKGAALVKGDEAMACMPDIVGYRMPVVADMKGMVAYGQLYRWLTEISGLGLAEQARRTILRFDCVPCMAWSC